MWSINNSMKTFKIIEDCSPFYIRFTFDGLEEIIKFVSEQTFLDKNCNVFPGYSHKNFTAEIGYKILKMLPIQDLCSFKVDRVAIFETPPGGGCGIHKDGISNKVSFNIPIEILDDKCITKWYDESQFENLEVQGFPYTRIVYKNFRDMEQFKPAKTMVAKANEMLIFNTDIFHSWQNQSEYTRKVLTIRPMDSEKLSFDEARRRLLS